MRNLVIFFIVVVFSFPLVQAQSWTKNNNFTEGAKIALHRVWGESMGFSSPEETAKQAKKIYQNGKFENKFVRNSGIKPDGSVTRLPNGTFQVVYLGSTDATILGGVSGETLNLYLKKDCMNLAWVVVKPQPKEKVIIKKEIVIVRDTIYEDYVVDTPPRDKYQPREERQIQQEQPCSCWNKFSRRYTKSNYGNPMWGTDNNYFDNGETSIGYFLFPIGVTPQSSRQVRWEERPLYMCKNR